MENELNSNVRALSRGLTLLMAVLEQPQGASVAELSRKTGLHKATVSRLLGTLSNEGYLSVHPRTGHYMVGAKLASRLRVGPLETVLAMQARPILLSLRDACNETVALYIPVWPDRVCVAQEQSTSGLRRVHENGETWPLTTGATGITYMSCITEEELKELLRVRPLVSRTTDSIVEESELMERILKARRDGFAMGFSDPVPAMAGLSTTVVQDGRPVAMITISGPQDRWNRDEMTRYIPKLLAASSELARLVSTGR